MHNAIVVIRIANDDSFQLVGKITLRIGGAQKRPSDVDRASNNLHSLAAVLSRHLSRLLATGLLGDLTPLGAVAVPQSAERLAGDHLAHVHTDQTQYEHAVSPQIALCELGEDARLALRRVERPQLLADIAHLTAPVERAHEPLAQVNRADDGEEHVPEPDEDEDFLVEEVYREHALHDVAVQTRLVADLEVAQCDPREALRCRPVPAAHQPLDDVGPVQMVFHAEEGVEHEQLPDGVRHIDHLDDEVCRCQIVAIETAANETAHARHHVLGADATSGSVVALRQKISVHLVDDVTNGLLAYL